MYELSINRVFASWRLTSIRDLYLTGRQECPTFRDWFDSDSFSPDFVARPSLRFGLLDCHHLRCNSSLLNKENQRYKVLHFIFVNLRWTEIRLVMVEDRDANLDSTLLRIWDSDITKRKGASTHSHYWVECSGCFCRAFVPVPNGSPNVLVSIQICKKKFFLEIYNPNVRELMNQTNFINIPQLYPLCNLH